MSNTPKKIDDTVIEFCKSIVSSAKPEYITVCAESWCKPNECYDNVQQKVRTNGGKRQLGWRIQVVPDPMPKFMIEAVHHAIWITETGEKIDITPQESYNGKIVFIEDNITQLGEYRIGEKYQALMKNKCVTEYVRLCNLESSEYVSKTKLDKQPIIPNKLLEDQNKLLLRIMMECR